MFLHFMFCFGTVYSAKEIQNLFFWLILVVLLGHLEADDQIFMGWETFADHHQRRPAGLAGAAAEF